MGLRALDRKLLRDLWRLRGQAVAVAMIIICGEAIMVMALGTLNSLQVSQSTYYERYRFADVFVSVTRAPQSMAARLRELPGVQAVETRVTRLVTLRIEGFDQPVSARLQSIPEHGLPPLNRILLHRGRLPEEGRADEVIASKAFVDAHGYRLGDSVTALINGRARDLAIVGVGDSPEHIYTLPPGSLFPDDLRFGVFWMREQALRTAFDLEGAFNEATLKLGPGASTVAVIRGVDRLLDRYGGTGAYAREDQLSHAFIDSEMKGLRSVAGIIPPVFLVVSAVLLNAILLRLVATERGQIGILKAFGYTHREILVHYVKLAAAISVLGIIGGFVVGVWLGRVMTGLYADSFRFPELYLRLSPAAFVISALTAGIACVAGALNAALRAAALSPAAAISGKPPVAYERSLLQRLGGLLATDAPTRMIMRHITRWPLRSAATVLGVAAAQTLLVGTLFVFDSVDEMIDQLFFRADNYDAAVNFYEVRGGEGLREVAALPGVLAVEPTRVVSAKLRNGVREERVAIIGLRADGRLKRVFDEQHTALELPAEGIVLASQLAEMLDVGPGREVAVELLEGRRTRASLHVSALTDDYVGAQAYMRIDLLNALLQEGEVVTGVYARVDPARATAFSRGVVARPGIANVTMEKASYDSFKDTLSEQVSIMMTIYALIGAAVAAGVVYNSARITLLERSRDLASLRVLGFTRGEVAYILIGELALLVVLALPIGSLVGVGLAWLVSTSMATELYRVPVIVSPSTFGLAASIVLVATAGSIFLVQRRLDKLDLIGVLKTAE